LTADIVHRMSARAQQDRAVVALAAVSCGRLSGATTVRAGRGQALASADQYRVEVTEPGSEPRVVRGRGIGPAPEVVFEHWGGDAELLALRAPVTGAVGLLAPAERARVAARTFNYYKLDSLRIEYPDGAELSAADAVLVLHGPRRGWLRRRNTLLRALLSDLA
jgi:hypothetical protein